MLESFKKSSRCGLLIGPFALRSEALEAEREWLESHWLPNRQENVTTPL